VRVLSAGILSGKYKPGDWLNESQIARELNISRTPVREALSQLQEQGLVQNRERRGRFVTDIGPEEALQISSLRIILETEALRLAQARMTPEILAGPEKLVSEMDSGVAPCWMRPPWTWNSTAPCGRRRAIPIWSGR
jgi:DNA-binding GntR family transcriptional regulator